MSAEDRLREILRDEARAVQPSGDGLAVLRERMARRRRLRVLLVPAGALVTALAVVAVFVLADPSPTHRLEQPAATASPEPTVTVSQPPVSPYQGPMLWPFTSVQQGLDWSADHGARPWAGSATAVAAHLVSDLLKLPGVGATGDGPAVTLVVQGRAVGVVHLVSVYRDGPWSVTSVTSPDLTITSPTAGAAITSPTGVTGTVTGYHQNVQLQLITATGRLLASGGAPAGQEMPWQGELSWSDRSWFTAGVVGITRSDKDGAITRIAVVPVKRGRA